MTIQVYNPYHERRNMNDSEGCMETKPLYLEKCSRLPDVSGLCDADWQVRLDEIPKELAGSLKRAMLLQNLAQAARELRWMGLAGEDNSRQFMQVLLFIQRNELVEDTCTWSILNLGELQLIFSVRVKGEGWDERIDVRGARFILDTQKAVDSMFREIGGSEALAPQLKFRILKGSNEIETICKFLKTAVKNMSGTQIMVICLVFGGLYTGYMALDNTYTYLKAKRGQEIEYELRLKDMERQNADKQKDHEVKMRMMDVLEKDREHMTEMVQGAVRSSAPYTKPLRDYVESLNSTDEVSLSGSELHRVPDLRNRLKTQRVRHTMLDVDCDGDYAVKGIDMATHPVRLLLVQGGGQPISASLAGLPASERTTLVDQVRDALQSDSLPLILHLHLSVRCTKYEKKNAKVLGIGLPRAGITHYTLQELPSAIQAEFN